MAHEHGTSHHDTIIDPVCGMTIDPTTAATSQEYEGPPYYFCSAHGAATFGADPARYAPA